ncbi:MAG: peptidylprolyl isomerase [Bdellovibrionales bacterium]
MRLIAICLCLIVAVVQSPVRAAEMGIAVVVNDGAISLSDLNDRMDMIIVSSNLPDNKGTRAKLQPQIVGSLVEEELKLQEAKRLDLDVTQAEINEGFATIAQQNNFTPEQFKKILTQSKISTSTMERQIKSQIAWSKVVQARLRPQINISESDIDVVVDRLADREGSHEFLVSEIFLPVESADKEGEVKALAQKLIAQVRGQKAPFGRLAQQFSKAPGAPQGGALGWVQGGQLPEALDAVLPKIGKGDVSDPIRSDSGFHILQLHDKRVLSAEMMPDREQIATTLGMERLDRMQQRLLMDLKSAAFIENRLGS